MKTIFAATDFTQAAHNACVYAASLAGETGARLVLFSAFQPIVSPGVNFPLDFSKEEFRAPTELGLKTAARSIRHSHGGIQVETMCREGIAVNTIISAAKEVKADIIVLGMKEKGKGIRRIFGSTVTAVTWKSDLPVIVVPEGAEFVKPCTIALANDHDADAETDPHLLDTLLELGEQFSSKLYVVRIAKNQFQGSYEVFNRPLRLIRMVRALEPVYECVEGSNEEKALNEFVTKYEVDMLALLPHYHSMADRFFAKSTTRTLIFDSQVPLLILPGLRMQEQL